MNRFQWLNIGSASLQFLLFIGLIIWLAIKDKTAPPFSLAIGEYDGERNDVAECKTYGKPSFDVVVGLLLAFTGITCAFHTVYAFEPNFYITAVKGGNNWLRWGEYSMTATLMLVAIAMISAVHELDALILIAVCSAGCMMLGQTAESAMKTNNKSAAISATVVGWILLFGAFGVILRNYHKAANPEDPTTPKPPAIVTIIVYTMLVLFSSFGVINVFRTILAKGTPGEDYNRATEGIYSIASMVAKTLLVLLIYGGILGQTLGNDAIANKKLS